MDLFDQHRQMLIAQEAPLAARMRPRTLDEFIGQDAIIGQGRLLRRAIQADQLSSLIFYGPPGTGKTTLAQIIANTTRAHFIPINAVLAGVKEIREAIATAQDRRGMHGQRTILFVDEVHRFNKAQQDALLPWVENGTVILIGATTENPYFEVNKALVSRSRLFQLKPLNEDDLRQVVRQTLSDGDRGYGQRSIQLDKDALDHLVNVANGDARALLNALELAVETTPPTDGTIHISLTVAEESIQQRAVLYDKEGDVHFDTISAFIKSVRGSDPDAALYWLARMVYAGEDPRFIFRRLLILAGEDVGMADPQAIAIVNACAQAFDRVGMPEGRYPLAHATLYLATAPKSNSVMGFFDALAAVEQEREDDVPNHLRDANRDKKGFGHGAGYLYPHAYRDHWVEQQYLPKSLQGQVFYQPSNQGYERQIQTQVARRREAQLAAMLDRTNSDRPEILTYSPEQPGVDRWLQRALDQRGDQLAQVRDRLFALYPIQRHHVILDLNAGSGLLTWEAVRQVPEGGVYACAWTEATAEALTEQAIALPDLSRPTVIQSSITDLAHDLGSQYPALRFDVLIGHNVLTRASDKGALVRSLLPLLRAKGVILLAETIPRHTQRLYQLVERDRLKPRIVKRWIEAEEAIYGNPDDPMVNWDESDLEAVIPSELGAIALSVEHSTTSIQITPAQLDRWFPPQSSPSNQRPSYGEHLAQTLSPKEIESIEQLLRVSLTYQTVSWTSAIAYLTIQNA
ncbi:MAG: AAA family ATPase [Synechococcales cyanobacterium T60_A2020_003]|nr:AAA family ATPase [Synechococcales cyanobacterium T60_A2020_003]